MRSRPPHYHTDMATQHARLTNGQAIFLIPIYALTHFTGALPVPFGPDLMMCAISRNKKSRAGVTTDGKQLAGLGLARAIIS